MENLTLRRPPPGATVRLYLDDVKAHTNAVGQRWLYVGVLAIPEHRRDKALALLLSDRDEFLCESELHFSKLTAHAQKAELAGRWVDRFLYDDQRLFHFHVLGINLDNLHQGAFAKPNTSQSIYMRFVRTAVAYSLKHCFGTPVKVSRLFHDSGNLEDNPYFDWHSQWKIGQEHAGISFTTGEVLFVDSDHRRETRFPSESHFIQLTDLLLGSVRQCLDATSANPQALSLADKMYPLLARLMDSKRRNNPNSRFHHVRRCSVSFFPSLALSVSEMDDKWERARSSFYQQRAMLYAPQNCHQGTLFP